MGKVFRQFPDVLPWLFCEPAGLKFPSGYNRGLKMKERLKAFGRRCVGKVGGLLRHPIMIRLMLQVLGLTLLWLFKLMIIALLSMAGYALPAG